MFNSGGKTLMLEKYTAGRLQPSVEASRQAKFRTRKRCQMISDACKLVNQSID